MRDPDQGMGLIPAQKMCLSAVFHIETGFFVSQVYCGTDPVNYWCFDPRTAFFSFWDCILKPEILNSGVRCLFLTQFYLGSWCHLSVKIYIYRGYIPESDTWNITGCEGQVLAPFT